MKSNPNRSPHYNFYRCEWMQRAMPFPVQTCMRCDFFLSSLFHVMEFRAWGGAKRAFFAVCIWVSLSLGMVRAKGKNSLTITKAWDRATHEQHRTVSHGKAGVIGELVYTSDGTMIQTHANGAHQRTDRSQQGTATAGAQCHIWIYQLWEKQQTV